MEMYLIIGAVILIFFIFFAVKSKKNPAENPRITTPEKTNESLPYRAAASVLTPNEQNFYKILKPIADKYGLIVFTKIRLADLVTIPAGQNYIKWFNKIAQKHIDFILCKNNFSVKIVFEIDDKSHDKPNRVQRDAFVDKVCETAKIKIVHLRNFNEAEIENFLRSETNQ
jgi:hypothetical protein